MGWFMSKFVSFRQDRHVLALNAVEILLISTILVQHTLQKWILLFSKDALDLLKITVMTWKMLQNI